MKKLILSSFIFFSLTVYGQPDFSNQLRELVKNAGKQFKDYKGSFISLQEEDSVFSSTVTIAGTLKNDIVFTKEMTLYRTVIVDSVKLKKGKKVADEWANELRNILSGDFKQEAVKVVNWNPAKYGWKFVKGDTWISVNVYPYVPDSEVFWVSFGITQIKE